MLRKIIFVCIACLAVSNCGFFNKPSSSSLKDDVQNDSVSYERRSEALRRIKEMNTVYHTVRDGAYLGNSGIIPLSDSISAMSNEWRHQWQAISTFVDTATDRSIMEVDTELGRKFLAQRNLLAKIKETGHEIGVKTAISLNMINTSLKVDYPLEGYQDRYDNMMIGVNSLVKLLEETNSETVTHVNILDDLYLRLVEIMELKLKRNYINAQISNLEEALKVTRALFEAERVLGPLETEIQHKFLAFNQIYINGQYFKTKELHNELKELGLSTIAQINSTSISSKYKTAAVGRINALLAAAARNIAFLDSPDINIPALIAESIEERSFAAQTACTSGEPTVVNCDMYKNLANITSQQISTFDMKKLQNLEKAWDLIEGR